MKIGNTTSTELKRNMKLFSWIERQVNGAICTMVFDEWNQFGRKLLLDLKRDVILANYLGGQTFKRQDGTG